MKRLARYLLVLCLLLAATLAGCGKAEGEITGLLPAAEKLKTASSYRLRVIMTESNRVPNKEVTLEYLVAKDKDGTATIYHRYDDDTLLDGDTSYYYEGATGYVWYEYDPAAEVKKTVQDTPFTMADVLRQHKSVDVQYGEESMLALFDGMNPTHTKEEDGSLLLEIPGMTLEQFEKLFCAMNEDKIPPTAANGHSLTAGNVTARIHADGYLKDVTFSYTSEYDGREEQSGLRFVIDQIDDTTVEKPDFAK